MSVKPAVPVSPIGLLCDQKRRNCLSYALRVHYSCTRNDDHLALLINTGKKRMLLQTTVSFILLGNCKGGRELKISQE